MSAPLDHLAAARVAAPDLLGFLQRLVDCESPTFEKEMCDRVGEMAATQADLLGVTPSVAREERFGDVVLARTSTGHPEPVRVLLVGHLDTVFDAGTVAERPYTERDGRAHGPGVFDMKAGIAIGLWATHLANAAVADDAGARGLDITFFMNCDEECGSPDSRRQLANVAPGHDLVLVLEPGQAGPAITIGRKGVGIFRFDVTGAEAHAGADPDGGVNSILDLAQRIPRIAALADRPLGTTVNVGVVNGGTYPYVVPGSSAAQIDVRVPTQAEAGRVEEGFLALASDTFVPGARCELSGNFHRPPLEPTDDSRRFAALYQAAAASLGYQVGTASSGGASDGNLTAAMGIPTLDGLGADGAHAHSPKEYIDLTTVPQRLASLTGLLVALATA